MPSYLEIVRLNELSFSQRKISDMVGSGRPVIKRTIETAKQHKLTYKELSGWEADRIDTFFGPKPSKPSQREMQCIIQCRIMRLCRSRSHSPV